MKKNFLTGLLVSVLIALLLFPACAQPTPTPAPATTPAPAPAPSPAPAPAPVGVIELKVAVTQPPMAPPAAAVTAWTKRFEEVSGGRVKFTIYYASSLFEAKEILRSVLVGVADISDYWVTVDPGVMVLNQIGQLPFLGWPSPEKATQIYRDLLKQFPALEAEYQGVKLLYPTVWGETTSYLHTTKKLVQSAADLKGMKIGGSGGYPAKWQSLMGASPVFVAFEDTYMSLERGLIDGHFGTFGWQEGSGVIDLTPYHTDVGAILTMGYNPLIMNPDSWNKLPSDIQKIFNDLDTFYTDLRMSGELDRETKYVPETKEKGHTYFSLPPEETQVWVNAARPLHEDWIKEAEGKGKPAGALYEMLLQLIAKYK